MLCNRLGGAYVTDLQKTITNIKKILARFVPAVIFAIRKNERPVRLPVRTSDFHSGNRGSIPLRATKIASVRLKTPQIHCLRGFSFSLLPVWNQFSSDFGSPGRHQFHFLPQIFKEQ